MALKLRNARYAFKGSPVLASLQDGCPCGPCPASDKCFPLRKALFTEPTPPTQGTGIPAFSSCRFAKSEICCPLRQNNNISWHSYLLAKRCSQLCIRNSQCWSCGANKFDPKYILICPSCDAVQGVDPEINYFQIFDLKQEYELDLKELESKYKTLMKKLHPDLSHGKSAEEKENSAQISAVVTTAYNELLNPVSRAAYLLKLQGIHVEEEGTVNDPELIMEVMEIREALESSPNRETLQQLHYTARARMDQWSEKFNAALKEGNMNDAISALQRMSYFGRVDDDIKRELLQ